MMFAAAVIVGWLVEEIQGMLPALGRNKDVIDILADAIGGILGIAFFYICATIAERKLFTASSNNTTTDQ